MSEQLWEVVGGEETGGILVREGKSLSSAKADARLSHGAKVQQLDLVGERLNYSLQQGEGPETGWVSLSVKGKMLLEPCVPEEEPLPEREAGEPALINLVTLLEGKKQGTWQLKVPAECITVGDWREGIKRKELLDDAIVAQFADRLSVKRIYGDGNMSPQLKDSAQLPVDPAKVFVTGPGAVQGALARGLQDDFGEPFVPPSRRLVVQSSSPALQGGYEETFGGSNQFQKKHAKDSGNQEPMFLFRERDRTGTSGFRWFFGDDINSCHVSVVLESEDDSASPVDVTWPEEVKKVMFLADNTEEAESLFADEAFPPSSESLGDDLRNQLSFQPQWQPARHLHCEKMHLFEGISPNDLLQGQIGDCWLMAAMASLAEFPEEVKGIFKEHDEETGKSVLRLFNHRETEWEMVEVDEFIPCLPREWWDAEATPLFARPNGNEMWCVLLEKAMAKLFGTYGDLVANNCGVAFRAFTGTLDNLMWMRPAQANGAWLKYKLMQKGFDYDPCMQDADFRAEPDDFFRLLEGYDQESFLMSASMQVSHSVEFRRSDGLVEGHAYTLLKVAEVEGHRLLLMRNPWGNQFEWNGKWSDHSDMWEKYPAVKEELRPSVQDDGLFWMCFQDFTETWDMVNVCQKSMHTGPAKIAHAKVDAFVRFLAAKEKERPPKKLAAKLRPLILLTVKKKGEDSTEEEPEPAAKISAEKILEALLRRIFRQLDTSGDGLLQLSEATDGLKDAFGRNSEKVQRGEEVFQMLEEKCGGSITEEDFVQAGIHCHSKKGDSAAKKALRAFHGSHPLWAAVQAMDIPDEQGNIGAAEIASLLREAGTEGESRSEEFWLEAAQQLIAEKDQDGDGCLNMREFLALLGGMTSLCDAAEEEVTSSRSMFGCRRAKQLVGVGQVMQRLKGKRKDQTPPQPGSLSAQQLVQQLGQQALAFCEGCLAGLRS